jgi:hypothetical protein
LGDDWGNCNPNGTPWNDDHEVLSFWKKGGTFTPLYVPVSTSHGNHYVQYYSWSGTNHLESGTGNVLIYLGDTMNGSGWKYFQRNIEVDFHTYSSDYVQNIDGILIWTGSIMYIRPVAQ